MKLFNTEALADIITKITRQVVREELERRGDVLDQKMFNRKDAAKYLGVSGRTIDNMVGKNLLKPTFPIPSGNKYYLREDLNEFAENGKRYLKKTKLRS